MITSKQVTPNEVQTKLREIVRHAALRRLESCTRSQVNLTMGEVENPDDFAYGYWMSFILLSGNDLQLIFKVHFYSDEARHLTAKGLKREPGEITYPDIKDFMKEFCNLVAGEIKAGLSAAKVMVGLSLPLVTRGFDEVIFSDSVDSRQFSDWWRLSWASGVLTLSFVAEVYQLGALADLKTPSAEFRRDGDIDFL